MHIYFIVSYLFPPKTYGGGDLVHRKIYEYLQHQGIEIEVICLPELIEKLSGKGYKSLKSMNIREKLYIMFKILWSIKEKRGVIFEDAYFTRELFFYNIYHKFFSSSNIITYLHHFDYYRNGDPWSFQKMWLQFKEHLLFSFVDKIVVNSRCTRREVLSLGIKNKKVEVVFPGIDYQAFRRFPKVESGILNLLFVGHYRPRKGIHYLLEAIKKLNHPEIKLHLVGRIESSQYYLYLLDLVKKLNLVDKVIFYGSVDHSELCHLYSQADIFILPSLWEGFGIVLLEAMYYRLPIVASNISAIPELVKDGENGLFVPPADAEALAGAISKLIKNPGLREKMGNAGYNKVVNEFSWEKTGSKFYQIITNLNNT